MEVRVNPKAYDFKELGLKVGLEIHQQLDTKHKLFCKCPSQLAEKAEEDVFPRRLRPTRSELGEVDVAALFEWRRGRVYEYHAPRSSTCLVEADEEPPHPINREALVIGLAVAKALHATVVDEVHVMRKIVIDGSNTTGFQRTAIIALGGYIELPSGKRVRIQSIAVEEDAARKVGEKGKTVFYKLDRLGIPLIEISTEPDIETPEEAYETALAVGRLLRLMGKVKRGIGTIRQDLNVSIRGGVKTEIKGVQRLDLLPKIVAYEAIRQARLLEIRDELKRRGLTRDRILAEAKIKDVTEVFRKTRSKIIRRALASGGKVLALKLPGFHGLLGVEVQPGRRFGTELADYARFWGGVGGIFHSDELPGYGITEEELNEVFKELGAAKGRDAVVIVADEERKARKALEAVLERAAYAVEGIPRETRAAQDDGTTRYMRPQPGAARMYPETDIPPVEVTEEMLREAEKLVPEPPHVKLEKLVTRYGLSREQAQQLLMDIRLDLFEALASKYADKVPPTFIAGLITNVLRMLRHEGIPVDNIDDRHIEELVKLVAEGKLPRDFETSAKLLAAVARDPRKSIEQLVEEMGLGMATMDEVVAVIDRVIEELKAEISEKGMKAFGKVMGRVMSVLRGRADGRTVAEIVRKKITELVGSHEQR
jgi:glutamyl-tRNA(Gln) amidotransferase subunit E